MFIIKKPDCEMLKAVVKELKAGAVMVFPTDTAYGLGCDATNARAVAKIFKIKGRAAGKALPMIVADADMAKHFFAVKAPDAKLAAQFWPGPLSIILAAKPAVVKTALAKGTAAVRVPALELARTLSKRLGRPLVATSANLSGAPACYSIRAFLGQAKNMKTRPELVIDAGALRRRRPSTIVRAAKSGTMEVLRKGPIKIVGGLDIRH